MKGSRRGSKNAGRNILAKSTVGELKRKLGKRTKTGKTGSSKHPFLRPLTQHQIEMLTQGVFDPGRLAVKGSARIELCATPDWGGLYAFLPAWTYNPNVCEIRLGEANFGSESERRVNVAAALHNGRGQHPSQM